MIKKFPLSYSLCTFLVLISASQLIKAQTKVDPFGMGPHTTLDVVLAAAKAPSSLAVGPTEASWESIRSTYQIPAWFMDAKFGIFIHWGLFSTLITGLLCMLFLIYDIVQSLFRRKPL